MPVSGGLPKCLMQVGGRTLLSRHFDNLARVGINQVVLVVGHQHVAIREAARVEPFGGSIRFLMNEDYERGSITSLWAGAK